MSERRYQGIVGQYVCGEVNEDQLYSFLTRPGWKKFNPAEHTPLPLNEDGIVATTDYDVLLTAYWAGDISDGLYERVENRIDELIAA